MRAKSSMESSNYIAQSVERSAGNRFIYVDLASITADSFVLTSLHYMICPPVLGPLFLGRSIDIAKSMLMQVGRGTGAIFR